MSAIIDPLKGKTALISGSCSGIGASIAMELSLRGANIVLNYPDADHKEAGDKVGETLQTSWISVEADLAKEQGCIDLVAAAVKRFGQIDILVHNAAVFPNCKPWEVEAEEFDKAMTLNTRAPLLLTKAALPHMTPFKPQDSPPFQASPGGGRIIAITSGTCRIPQPGGILYGATKAALEAIVRNWARELPPKYGVTVNAVSPGPIWTELMASLAKPEQLQAAYQEATPVEGCVGHPEDVARAVAYLADPTTKWVNGAVINVNGGFIMT